MSILTFSALKTLKKRVTAFANKLGDILRNLGDGPDEPPIVFSDDSMQTLGVSFKDPTDDGYYFLAYAELINLAASNSNRGLGYISGGGDMLVPDAVAENVYLLLLERVGSVKASLQAGTQPQSVGVFDKHDGVRAYRDPISDKALIVDKAIEDKGRLELA